jgi:hypothetical protein
MKLVLSVVAVAAGCTEPPPPPPALSEVVSAISPSGGQGTDWQGTDWQGTDWQGTDWQGTDWQGTSLANVTVASSVGTATIHGAVLSVWRLNGGGWEQRLPNMICNWDMFKLFKSCTSVDLATQPSPLAGIDFVGTFRKPDGTTFTSRVRIGTSATDVGAVARDTKSAMFALLGHAETQSCALTSCTAPEGCRANCDIWLYDIRMVDHLDTMGLPARICPTGQALAVGGTYDSTGKRSESQTAFTFGCTSGTMAKCTRWGYRPFGSAYRVCSSPGCTDPQIATGLVGYHQSCVFAAKADYCADGDSFTKNGTLVDVSDFGYANGIAYRFVPSLKSVMPTESAFVWESTFDRYGATKIDHIRYADLQQDPTLTYRQADCLGSFVAVANDSEAWHRPADGPPVDLESLIYISSSPACAHSEQTIGRSLHRDCSPCTQAIDSDAAFKHCTNPTDSRGWDAACAVRAQQCTTSQLMASHGECATGGSLTLYDSLCTMTVCSDPATAACCQIGKTAWTASCVTAANRTCTGGRESGVTTGFCGVPR